MKPLRSLLIVGMVCLVASVTWAEAKKPNILFFFSDDLTTQAISAYKYGMDLPLTPNIDRLAREGMLFENSFCGNSICTPSRGTVMTGLHSHKNKIVNLGEALDPSLPTWPKTLHVNGYTTAVFGKWHLKTKPKGFDAWEVFSDQGDYYNPQLFSEEGNRIIQGHSTDVVTDLALDWLDVRDTSKPFVLMVQHKAPHRNWKPSIKDLQRFRGVPFPEPPTLFDAHLGRPSAANHKMGIDQHMRMAGDLMLFKDAKEEKKYLYRLTPAQRKAYMAAFAEENAAFKAKPLTGKDLVRWKYQRYMRIYLSCVAGVDRNVGRVLDRLDALDLTENTVVVYCADQGFYLGEHGWFDKRWAYEESMRMPFIVRWPGQVTPGSRCSAMIQNIDYAPTFLAMASLTPDWQVHGLNLVPLLTGGGVPPADWRDTLYYRYMDGGHGVARHSAIRTNEYKLIHFDQPRNETEKQNRWELYDVQNDPQDMINLAFYPQHQDLFETMKARFWETRQFYGDTDEKAWIYHRTRYAEEDYIRPPKK